MSNPPVDELDNPDELDLPDVLADLGTEAGDDSAELLDAMVAAGFTDAEIATALGAVITGHLAAADAAGRALGVLQLEAWGETSQAARAVAPASPAMAREDARLARLLRAAGTVTGRMEREDPASLEHARMAAHRLARSETIEAVRDARSEAVLQSPTVRGWTRQLERTACELCTWWSRGGRVWRANHAMPTHKGCTCLQRFVQVEKSQAPGVSPRAYAASRRREAAGSLDERRMMHEGAYSETATRGKEQANE